MPKVCLPPSQAKTRAAFSSALRARPGAVDGGYPIAMSSTATGGTKADAKEAELEEKQTLLKEFLALPDAGDGHPVISAPAMKLITMFVLLLTDCEIFFTSTLPLARAFTHAWKR